MNGESRCERDAQNLGGNHMIVKSWVTCRPLRDKQRRPQVFSGSRNKSLRFVPLAGSFGINRVVDHGWEVRGPSGANPRWDAFLAFKNLHIFFYGRRSTFFAHITGSDSAARAGNAAAKARAKSENR